MIRSMHTVMGVSLVALAASGAQAQEDPSIGRVGLEEIVVTAQKREQRLQDVPVAVTALSANALQANRIENVMDLSSAVPNLTARPSSGGGHIATFVLRGAFGNASSPGSETQTGVYVDGIYVGATSGAVFSLPNIERIEVARGPQGTLFGQNATAGAISIVTPDPTGELSITQRVTVGNYSQLESKTVVDLPAFGPFSLLLAYSHSERRGDMRNLGAGTTWDFGPELGLQTSPKYLGNSNRESIQAALKVDPGADFTATYKFFWVDEDSTPEGNGLLDVYTGGLGVLGQRLSALFAANPSLVPIGQFERPKAVNNWFSMPQQWKNQGHILTAQWQASDSLSFKNTFGYLRNRFYSINDISGMGGIFNTNPDLGPLGEPFNFAANTSSGGTNQWSNEFQLNYNSELLTLTAGYLHYKLKNRQVGAPGLRTSYVFGVYPNFVVPGINPNNPPISKNVTKADAIYSQVELHVTPALDVIAGVRYTWDNKTSLTNNANVPPFTRYKDHQVSYTAGVSYKPSQDIMVYGKYSKGYLAGGAFSGWNWEPEFAKSWEAGVKTEFFDRRARANLTLFTTKYSNIQGSIGGPILASIYGRPELTPIGSTIANIGFVRAKGIEFEGSAVPVDGLTLGVGMGYTDVKLLRFSDPLFAQDLTFRSKFTGSASVQYDTQPLSGDAYLSFRADINHRSKYDACKFNLTPLLAEKCYSPATTIVNGRIALKDIDVGMGSFEVAAWARNLLNERSLAYPPSYPFLISTTYERARTFGLDLTFRY